MKCLRTAALLSSIALTFSGARSEDTWKAQLLSASEEKAWISAAKNLKAEDGATVLEVLQYAEQLRPRKFKLGELDIGYNGSDGKADGVTIDYWIGMKRLKDDAYSLILEALRTSSGQLIVRAHPYTAEERRKFGFDHPEDLLLQGRDAFLRYIDSEYEDRCIDFQTKENLC